MQRSFAELEFGAKKKRTRRERFLAELDALTPWAELQAQIEPFYPRGQGRGRPPMGLARMLRMYLVQQCLGLSDEGMEDAVYDSQAIRSFLGIDLAREAAPDATTLLKFRRLLERHGHEVAIANSAKDARRLFAERSFELLLTDVVLSDASGPELANELLAIRPALKVVYMSGYTEQGVRSQRTLPGDVAFIQKPFTADVLVRTIASVIARPAGDDSTAG